MGIMAWVGTFPGGLRKSLHCKESPTVPRRTSPMRIFTLITLAAVLSGTALSQTAGPCTPASTAVNCAVDEYIAAVNISNLSNTSQCVGPPSYENFTTSVAPVVLVPGQTYAVGVTVGNYWTTDRVYVFLDGNGNNLFESGELLATLVSTATGSGTTTEVLSGTIAVPSTFQSSGRLRFRLSYGALPVGNEACANNLYGNCEDYFRITDAVTVPSGAIGTRGVRISEVVYGPSLGAGMPSYVELVNTQTAAPGSVNPVSLAAASLSWTPPGTTTPKTFAFPVAFVVSVGAIPKPGTTSTTSPVAILASGPFPTGMVPSNVPVLVNAAFFTSGSNTLGQPGVPFDLCLGVPSIASVDRLASSANAVGGCQSGFTHTGSLVNTNGKITRWTYMDSNTDLDFETTFAPSPGAVNPQMVHVNGFVFSNTQSPTGFPIFGGGTGGTLSNQVGVVSGVHFLIPNGTTTPTERVVTHPAFDRIVNGNVVFNAPFTADPTPAPVPPWLPSLRLWGGSTQLVAPAPSPTVGPGVMTVPLNAGSVARTSVKPDLNRPGNFVIERLLTDFVSDDAPTYGGFTSTAQEDTAPESTGGGDVWCEAIVYDHNGNAIRALAKNWPPARGTGPKTAFGTAADGTAMLVNAEFPPSTTVLNLFSFVAPNCPGYPQGFCPDGITSLCLTTPFAPFLVTTDLDGTWCGEVPNMPVTGGATIYWISAWVDTSATLQTTTVGQTTLP